MEPRVGTCFQVWSLAWRGSDRPSARPVTDLAVGVARDSWEGGITGIGCTVFPWQGLTQTEDRRICISGKQAAPPQRPHHPTLPPATPTQGLLQNHAIYQELNGSYFWCVSEKWNSNMGCYRDEIVKLPLNSPTEQNEAPVLSSQKITPWTEALPHCS